MLNEKKTNLLTVWCLDDEAELTVTLKQSCEKEFQLHLYQDPTKLISDFQSKPAPEIIVTDINLPTWDGFSVIKHIQNLGFRGEVIYISGYTQSNEFQKISANQQIMILEKPFSLQQFKNQLRLAANAYMQKRLTLSSIGPNADASQLGKAQSNILSKIKFSLEQRHQEDRKFLHDLAPPIMILSHVLNKFAEDLESAIIDEQTDKQRKNLARALLSLEQMKTLHASQKLMISKREHEDKTNMHV